jgi:serine/threonine-protein kinase
MSTDLPPDNDPPEGPDAVPPQPPAPGGERTVIASPDVLAAALRAQEASQPPPNPQSPFSVPPEPPAADPFASSFSQPPAYQPPPAFQPPPPPMFVGTGSGNQDQLIGVQLNDLFEVVRFIAEGGMGRVYEGRNIASGEQVAIKVILSQYAADDQFMALFRREASALEKIGHDALVKYRALAFDRGRGINYLAIEYVDGPSMANVLHGDPSDPALVRRVLRRMAQGLHAAHEAGVIHRDLSPDNVLLPGGNIDRCKIIDFGIAKDNNPGQKSVVGEAFAGKFGYAAPEVFGKYGRHIGAWTDIYSLGLVIAALARGTPVEMGITIVDALEARDSVPDLTGVSADLQPIIAKMLAPDPADRFQTMEEVADAADPRGTMFMANAAQTPAAPAFVKADNAAAVDTGKPKGKLPVAALAGVAAVVITGGAFFALSGSDDPAAPAAAPVEVAETAVPAPAAGADPVASAADWATSAPQVFAALNQLRCADVRVDGVPSGGRVRLTGWRSATTPMPTSVAGWQLEGSGVAPVSAPSAQACRVADSIRDATGSSPDTRFRMPGSQILNLSSLAGGSTPGFVQVDLDVTDRPAGRLLMSSIDDRATTTEGLVVSGDLDRYGLDVGAIDFERKPGRYLLVLVAAPQSLPEVTATGAPPSLASACRNNACQLTSGWIEVR